MSFSKGEFFDGKSSRSEQVDLQITSLSVLIRNESGHMIGEWELERLRDENIPRDASSVLLSLSADNPARLRVVAPEILSNLREKCPNFARKRKAEKREWPKLAASAVGTLLIVATFVYFGMPVVASAVAQLIPDSTREQLGQTVEAQIMQHVEKANKPENSVCSSTVAVDALERVVAEFSNENPISILVVKSKVANAFALPGGRLIVFSGLIEKASSPNALAGVLAHEVAHVEARHPTSLLVANLGMAAILSVALGDVTGGTVIAGVGQMALGASYSRDFERAADERAIELMRKYNYDLAPLIPLLLKIQKGSSRNGLLSFMESHPGIEGRIETLKAAGKTGENEAFSVQEWHEIKVICEKSI